MRKRVVPRRGWVAALLAATGLALGAGAAFAVIPDADGEIHTCFSPKSALARGGTPLRIVDPGGQGCQVNDRELTFNRQGPPGPAGPAGPPGAVGVSGWQLARAPIHVGRRGKGVRSAIARCAAGKRVVGGGVDQRYLASIQDSVPLLNGSGWYASIRGTFAGNEGVVGHVRAICVNVGS